MKPLELPSYILVYNIVLIENTSISQHVVGGSDDELMISQKPKEGYVITHPLAVYLEWFQAQ